MVRYLARSCSENPVISRNLRTAFQLRPGWAGCMSGGGSMLFSPSALPMRVPGMMVADPTNVAIDLVLGTAMLILYSGSCHNGSELSAKWQVPNRGTIGRLLGSFY